MGVLLGREPELGALESALTDARAGRGRLFLLVGEPGIGKTRLADELVARAGEGVRVLWGRCWEAGGAPAYWPWIEVLRPLLDEADPMTLAGELGPAAVGLAALMPELRARLPGLPAEEPEDSEAARFLLFDAIARLLRGRAARTPLLIVLDDLHAADQPSLRLLDLVARGLRGSRMMIVGTYRDAEARLSPATAGLLSAIEREGQRFPLRRLSSDEVAAYIATASGAPADPAVVAAVTQTTEGTPLFVAEVARLVIAEGLLDAGALASRLLVPDGIRPAIRGHLGRVSEQTRAMLRAAAIVGRDFTTTVLQTVHTDHGGGPADLYEALAEAERAGLIQRLRPEHPRFRFSHMLVRETIYQDIGGVERERLHAEVARALESLDDGGEPDLVATLAHHFSQAGLNADPAKAALYSRRAGERALHTYAHEEAAAHFERALSALPSEGQNDPIRDRDHVHSRAELLVMLARAHQLSGDRASARAACAQAAVLARRLGDTALLARIALQLGAEFSFAFVDDTLVTMLEETLAGLGDGRTTTRARLMARLAAARQPARDPDEPIRLAQQAVALARTVDDRPTLAAVLRDARAAYLPLDRLEERMALDLEALAVAFETKDTLAAVHALLRLASERVEEGKIDAAQSHLDQYDRLVLDFRQPHRRWWSLMLRAEIQSLLGNFAGADQLHEELEPIVAASQNPNARVFSLLSRFGHALSATRFDEIPGLQERLETAIAARGAADDWFLLFMIRTATLTGPALGAAMRAFPIDRYPARFAGQQHFAEMAAASGEKEVAARFYERLLPWSGRFTVNDCKGSYDFYLGLLAAALGRREDARRHFEDAITDNERIGARTALARSLLAFADFLRTGGDDRDTRRAEELRARARGIGETLGMPGLLARLGIASQLPPPRRQVTPAIEFQREGDAWSVTFDGATYRFKDSKGMQIVAHLLRNSGRELHVLHLAGIAGGQEGADVFIEGAAGVAPDAGARAAYRERIADLEEDLRESEANGDIGRATRTREELDFLAEELARGVGLGGHERKTGSSAERARVNIQRRISDALRKVEEACPALGRRLSRAIRTGAYCLYEDS